MSKLKLLELFGGIGACSRALDHLGIEYELVDYVEIDKYACKSFNAIHGTNFEPQDVKEWDKKVEVDLIMHGSPCQDFSISGKGQGGNEGSGTRSSLMYETIRIVSSLKPKYVLWENVKNLLSEKHRYNFEMYLDKMDELGYRNYYKVLNAKDYGVPQNRERVFTVSIRKDIQEEYKIPEPIPLELRLKDILEDQADEKYYINEEQINALKINDFTSLLIDQSMRGMDMGIRGYNKVAPTLTSRDYKEPRLINETVRVKQIGNLARYYLSEKGVKYVLDPKRGMSTDVNPEVAQPLTAKGQTNWTGTFISPDIDHLEKSTTIGSKEPTVIHIKNANKKGYEEAEDGDFINLQFPNSETRRGRVGKQVAQTILASDAQGVVTEKLRIRRLTPKECWRLMGFDDEAFEKARQVNSDTQLYKQAGNSIVVDVLEAILTNLLINPHKLEKEQMSMFDFIER